MDCAPRAAAACWDVSPLAPDWTSKASWSRIAASGPCPSRSTHPTLVDVIDSPSTDCTYRPTLIASYRETDVAVADQALARSDHSLLAPVRHLVKMRKHTTSASSPLSRR